MLWREIESIRAVHVTSKRHDNERNQNQTPDIGRPTHDQAQSWDKPRRVIAKIEWHPGELFPRVGFIVTNMPMDPDWVVRFYNQLGTAEQHIKEGKYTFCWTRLSCRKFRDNEVRLQLHALAKNLATFLRITATHAETEQKRRTGLPAALKNTTAEAQRGGLAV